MSSKEAPQPIEFFQAFMESAKASWQGFPDPMTEEEVEDMALADAILAACHAIASEVEATEGRTRLREISSSVVRALETIGTLSEWDDISKANFSPTNWTRGVDERIK